MRLFTDEQRHRAELIGSLAYTNPFLPQRITNEKEILGREFIATSPVWRVDTTMRDQNPNLSLILARAKVLLDGARSGLSSGLVKPDREDLEIYEGLALYVLFYKYESGFYDHMVSAPGKSVPLPSFSSFEREFNDYFGLEGYTFAPDVEPAHLFAIFFQLRRAFHFTFRHILGGSMASARLRASVWQSIFTSDFARYRRGLFRRMHDISTLITGPSGTGKDLVASAIGLARYIPFDRSSDTFRDDFRDVFRPLNISALSPSLVESELFGHRKGAFTGAVSDREGHLDATEPWRTIFLDEIGDVDSAIQVKLLRVLQSREFHRLGDRVPRRFEGKIIAATNQDLQRRIGSGAFRADLYYRLCSDTVMTPSLAEQIDGCQEELRNLVGVIVDRLVDPQDRREVVQEVFAWTIDNLGVDYSWPGNMRELGQCVHNHVIRGEYHPLESPRTASDELVERFREGAMSAQELMTTYCTMIYYRTGNFMETARILGIDRRTVRAKVDERILRRLERGP